MCPRCRSATRRPRRADANRRSPAFGRAWWRRNRDPRPIRSWRVSRLPCRRRRCGDSPGPCGGLARRWPDTPCARCRPPTATWSRAGWRCRWHRCGGLRRRHRRWPRGRQPAWFARWLPGPAPPSRAADRKRPRHVANCRRHGLAHRTPQRGSSMCPGRWQAHAPCPFPAPFKPSERRGTLPPDSTSFKRRGLSDFGTVLEGRHSAFPGATLGRADSRSEKRLAALREGRMPSLQRLVHCHADRPRLGGRPRRNLLGCAGRKVAYRISTAIHRLVTACRLVMHPKPQYVGVRRPDKPHMLCSGSFGAHGDFGVGGLS